MENPFEKGDKVYMCGPDSLCNVIDTEDPKWGSNTVLIERKGFTMWVYHGALSFIPFEPGEMPNHERPFVPEEGKIYEFYHGQDGEVPKIGFFMGAAKDHDGRTHFLMKGHNVAFLSCRPIPPSKLGK